MRATSKTLDRLLLHLSGQSPLREVIHRGARLDKGEGRREALPEDFLDSFGKREFYAAVCFIDMRGFSEQSRHKTPSEVRALAAPFLQAIIQAAAKRHCFVDKTIGDEAMLIMPFGFGGGDPLSDVVWLLRDIMEQLNHGTPLAAFSAGIAFGDVLLDQIEAGDYSEWTVFGNCVNGAKRLQTISEPVSPLGRVCQYKVVLGAVDAEQPDFNQIISNWLENKAPKCPLDFVYPHMDCRELKGVGRMCFLASYLQPRRT